MISKNKFIYLYFEKLNLYYKYIMNNNKETLQLGGARRKNGHKINCMCHICENMRAKAKRGGYTEDAEKERIKRNGGSKKKNGHKPNCTCPICKNMNKKTRKGGYEEENDKQGGSTKKNGHKLNCKSPICKNMNKKSRKGGENDNDPPIAEENNNEENNNYIPINNYIQQYPENNINPHAQNVIPEQPPLPLQQEDDDEIENELDRLYRLGIAPAAGGTRKRRKNHKRIRKTRRGGEVIENEVTTASDNEYDELENIKEPTSVNLLGGKTRVYKGKKYNNKKTRRNKKQLRRNK